jgi:hypothetical protein
VKVDERALKTLSSIDVIGKLSEISMRGARYGFPGWVTEQTQKNGNTKHVYLDRQDACRPASEYLARANGPVELVGRQLALIVMAVYGDQDAVAQSNRSWHTVTCEGPWAHEVPALIDELVAHKLPDSMLAMLKPVLGRPPRLRGRDTTSTSGESPCPAERHGITVDGPVIDHGASLPCSGGRSHPSKPSRPAAGVSSR